MITIKRFDAHLNYGTQISWDTQSLQEKDNHYTLAYHFSLFNRGYWIKAWHNNIDLGLIGPSVVDILHRLELLEKPYSFEVHLELPNSLK